MVRVLLDHNMPPAIAKALHEIIKVNGHSAFALRDRFRTNIADIDYFNELGREKGWIVISKDLANSRKKAERQALLENKIVAFYLSKGLQKKKLNEQAAAILWHWDKIVAQCSLVERGLFQIPENKGKFATL